MFILNMKQKQKLEKRLAKIEKELDKIGFDTPLKYGFGTQRLGHAQRKRDMLAQEKFNIISKLNDLENE